MKCYAFISYNHRDVKVAKWLHRKLESYKLPTEIHNEFEDSKYLRPVFRDQEDLNAGVLSDELRKHLESSKYLIVICSPNSARSGWVSNEVKTFIEWGRLEYIIPFIIDGTPNSGDAQECFPRSLKAFISEHPDRELLGIRIAEVGREKAFVRVISRMLGINFDVLWKRHERERKRNMIFTCLSVPIILALLYYFALPVSLTVTISDEKSHLPLPHDAIITINGANYPLGCLDTTLRIKSLPGYYRGRFLPFHFSATWYVPLHETIFVGWGLEATLKKVLQRDHTFSEFSGKVIDDKGHPIEEAIIRIGGEKNATNEDGHFSFTFPVRSQSETKKVSITKDGYKEYRRDDECPGTDLIYILRKQ